MSASRKRKKSSELDQQLQEIENKVLKLEDMTEGLFDLDDNNKRWILVGIGLHTVLSPALREYIRPKLDQLWQTLNNTNNIETQLYPNHMACYITTHFNYEAINNNRTLGLRQQANFDYKVKNSVDLSKLFLQTNMAKYTGFDESCDLSALLWILMKTGICSPTAQQYAGELKDQVRNQWAHCDFTMWDEKKQTDSFDIMEKLVDDLGLTAKEELDKWRTNGKEFIQGKANVMTDVSKQIKHLLQYVDVIANDTPEKIQMLKKRLSEAEKKFTNFECRMKKLEQDVVSNQKIIRERQIMFKGKSGLVEAKIKNWREEDKTFVVTKGVKSILKCVQENKCVTITGSSGMGKTATLRHIVLQMADHGYDIIPVNDPHEIELYYNSELKTIFIVDDFCGTFSANKMEVDKWKAFIDQSYMHLNNNVKIIVATRLQVFNDHLFETLSVFKACECSLMSNNFKSSNNELQSIATLYLNSEADKISEYVGLYHCFPLLCKLYKRNPSHEITQFFQNPFSVYEMEIDNMFTAGHFTKYCALMLCVVFNNSLEESLLTDEIDEETRTIFQNVFEVCRLNRETSRIVIQDELNALLTSFIRKEEDTYMTIHGKTFDFLSHYFGKNMTVCKCLIRNARSRYIKERFSLFETPSSAEFTINLETSLYDIYLKRMIKDWRNGNIIDVFENTNMELKEFRNKFLCCVKRFDQALQQQLADTSDKKSNNTVLLECCLYGDMDWVTWCFDYHINVNTCETDNGASPLHSACYGGHTNTVKTLLARGADINKCTTDNGASPLHSACYGGHTDTVKTLLDRGADINKCTTDNGASPLHSACYGGHTDTVKTLLDRGADINKCPTDEGVSPLCAACCSGITNTVKVLLDRGADINKCTTDEGVSPLFVACYCGHTDTVKTLLDRGADINKCRTDNGASPLHSACYHGHTDTVKTLLDRGADINKCTTDEGVSPLFVACYCGHTDTAKVLLDRGASLNICTTT